MDIQNPKDLTNTDLRIERHKVIREMSRMALYLGVLNEETITRLPSDTEATVINIDRSKL